MSRWFIDIKHMNWTEGEIYWYGKYAQKSIRLYQYTLPQENARF